jgi:hypothetical protein
MYFNSIIQSKLTLKQRSENTLKIPMWTLVLPYGIFSNQKTKVGQFLREDIGIGILLPFGLFYSHWVYFMDIWCTLWQFGTICGNFGINIPLLVCCPKKNLATLVDTLWKN